MSKNHGILGLRLATNSSLVISIGISGKQNVNASLTLSPVVPSSTHASARRLFGDTVVGVEAVLEVLAVLVRGVVGEHLAAGCALERLEARLALDRLGGGVLHAGVSTATGWKGRGACVQPSAGSWPPWDQRRPCGRASAVLCERR
jgi:hypothetical protein